MPKSFIKVAKNQLYSYLSSHYEDGTLIKFFNNKEHALMFRDGYVCLGTAEYYRRIYEGDGRGDRNELSTTFPYVMGDKLLYSGQIINIDIPEMKGRKADITFNTTALLLCFFCFGRDQSTMSNLKKLINRKNSLGHYLCVIKNTTQLINGFSYLKYIRSLDQIKVVPKLRFDMSSHGRVSYVSHPDDSGYQKINEEKYVIEQEYRFVFGFDVDGYGKMQKGMIASRFIYKTSCCIDVDIIEII